MSEADHDTPRLRLVASAGELAQLFGLSSPSAVSNWRQRYDDFPEPVFPRGTQPQYDVDDVLRWARRPDRPARLSNSPSWWWARTVKAFDSNADGHSTVRPFVVALVLLRAALDAQIPGVRPPSRSLHALDAGTAAASDLGELARQLEQQYSVLEGLLSDPIGALEGGASVVGDFACRLAAVAEQGLRPADQLDVALAELIHVGEFQ